MFNCAVRDFKKVAPSIKITKESDVNKTSFLSLVSCALRKLCTKLCHLGTNSCSKRTSSIPGTNERTTAFEHPG